MSLNRYEQTLYTYWENNPDERRHWQGKVAESTRGTALPVEAARALERELWEYLVERRPHVSSLRDLSVGPLRRESLLNLAELIIRLWGPLPKPRKPGPGGS